MASLTEVYRGGSRGPGRQRLYAGVVLFAAGAILTVGGIVVATTAGTTGAFGMSLFAARELAGVLAGIGLPATFLGAVTVLPRASVRLRGAAGLGSAVALLAVVYFVDVYPTAWFANAGTVLSIYFLGTLTAFWCLFVAVANYKARNDPGGTVNLEVRKEGRTRVIEVPSSLSGLGGIGLLGSTPDGDVETQTNRRDTTSDGGSARDAADGNEVVSQSPSQPAAGSQRADSTPQQPDPSAPSGPSEHELDPTLANAGPEAAPSTDGGTTSAIGQDPITDTAVHRGEPDSYCGNCRHFQYVMDGDDVAPYCSFHGETLDDMDACPAWVDNG